VLKSLYVSWIIAKTSFGTMILLIVVYLGLIWIVGTLLAQISILIPVLNIVFNISITIFLIAISGAVLAVFYDNSIRNPIFRRKNWFKPNDFLRYYLESAQMGIPVKSSDFGGYSQVFLGANNPYTTPTKREISDNQKQVDEENNNDTPKKL